MMLGRQRMRTRARYAGASGAAPATTPLTAIETNGWYATYPGIVGNSTQQIDPISNPEYLPLTRAGFDASGNPTTYAESLLITTCIRQLTPNQANFEANAATLEDFVYSSACDVGPAGFTNNSTLVSPVPVANWALADRLVVADTIELEVLAFHRNGRNGKMVPCVVFTAVDGIGGSVSQTVSTPTVSPRTSDRNAVLVYRCTLNISTLQNPSNITVSAKVYPWIGVAASVADSSLSSVRRDFSPRYYRRDVARATTNKPVCYVTNAAYNSVPVGNDATGQWSQTVATAQANPFLTFAAAVNAITTQAAATGGIVDGCEIRIGNVSTPIVLGSASTNRPQNLAALCVTRDPDITKAQARVSWGAAACRLRLGGTGSLVSPLVEATVVFKELTINRTGTAVFQGETHGTAGSPIIVVFDDVDFSNGGFTGAITSATGSGAIVQGFNVPSGNVGNMFAPTTATDVRMLRGFYGDNNSNQFEGTIAVGNTMMNCGSASWIAARPPNNSIVAFNKFIGLSSTNGIVDINSNNSVALNGFAFWQNMAVVNHTTAATPGVRFCGDDSTMPSTSHVLIGNNSINTGGSAGRDNVFYDWSLNIPGRVITLYRHVGDIVGQLNNKGDVFVPADATRTAARPYWNGVGCQGNFTQYRVNSPPGEEQSYPGLRSNIATSATVLNSPQWVAPLGTTFNGVYTGGTATLASPGDLSLQVGSPAKGMVISSMVSHDLAGNARPTTNSSAGAYE